MTDQSQTVGIAHPTVVPDGDPADTADEQDSEEAGAASGVGAHPTVVPGGAD